MPEMPAEPSEPWNDGTDIRLHNENGNIYAIHPRSKKYAAKGSNIQKFTVFIDNYLKSALGDKLIRHHKYHYLMYFYFINLWK